ITAAHRPRRLTQCTDRLFVPRLGAARQLGGHLGGGRTPPPHTLRGPAAPRPPPTLRPRFSGGPPQHAVPKTPPPTHIRPPHHARPEGLRGPRRRPPTSTTPAGGPASRSAIQPKPGPAAPRLPAPPRTHRQTRDRVAAACWRPAAAAAPLRPPPHGRH